MILAASEATSKTVGLIVTFGGIGVLVNIIIVAYLVWFIGRQRQAAHH